MDPPARIIKKATGISPVAFLLTVSNYQTTLIVAVPWTDGSLIVLREDFS